MGWGLPPGRRGARIEAYTALKLRGAATGAETRGLRGTWGFVPALLWTAASLLGRVISAVSEALLAWRGPALCVRGSVSEPGRSPKPRHTQGTAASDSRERSFQRPDRES